MFFWGLVIRLLFNTPVSHFALCRVDPVANPRHIFIHVLKVTPAVLDVLFVIVWDLEGICNESVWPGL